MTTCVFISILCQFVESGVGCCVVLLGVWLPDAFDLNPVSQELAEWWGWGGGSVGPGIHPVLPRMLSWDPKISCETGRPDFDVIIVRWRHRVLRFEESLIVNGVIVIVTMIVPTACTAPIPSARCASIAMLSLQQCLFYAGLITITAWHTTNQTITTVG